VIDVVDPQLAIIFCNTKRGAEDLAGRVRARGYRAEELHGDMKQSQRDRVMGGFRKGRIDILIATDVAARGIDVDDVDMVINYDVPQDVEYYVHRIGGPGGQERAVAQSPLLRPATLPSSVRSRSIPMSGSRGFPCLRQAMWCI